MTADRPTDADRSEALMKDAWRHRAERRLVRQQARRERRRVRECLAWWGLSEPTEGVAP